MRVFAIATTLLCAVGISSAAAVIATDLSCRPSADRKIAQAKDLAPMAMQLPPVGSIAPSGWLLEQLLLQSNSLSGYMSDSTFPGAIDVSVARLLLLQRRRDAAPETLR